MPASLSIQFPLSDLYQRKMSENCPTQPDDSGTTRETGFEATLTGRRRIVESDYSAIKQVC
jgi:hypothetical protein